MNLYRVWGAAIDSDLPLPELTSANEGKADCVFRYFPTVNTAVDPGQWFHHWKLANGRTWLSFARQGADFLLRFPDLGDFLVRGDGQEIVGSPLPGTPLNTFRHLFLDQVLPLAMNRRGKLLLHASAVAVAGEAIAFFGASGQGKSTLTACFCERGFPLLSDDCLLIDETGERPLATPGYPGMRLWPDTMAALFGKPPRGRRVAHYSAKRRLGPENSRIHYCSEPAPLRRIYVLDPLWDRKGKKAIAISPYSGPDAFMKLVQAAYRLDITDKDWLKEEFESLGRLNALSMMYRLSVPRNLKALPAVCQAVLSDLGRR